MRQTHAAGERLFVITQATGSRGSLTGSPGKSAWRRSSSQYSAHRLSPSRTQVRHRHYPTRSRCGKPWWTIFQSLDPGWIGRRRANGSGRRLQGAEQFTAEVILWAVRWYLMFPISYRDLELMLLDRGVEVDHTTIFRWIQAYAEELEKRIRPHLRMSNGSWRVDETYVEVKGGLEIYIYGAKARRAGRADDRLPVGCTARYGYSETVLPQGAGQPHTVNPRTLTVDKNPRLSKGGRGDEERRRTLGAVLVSGNPDL